MKFLKKIKESRLNLILLLLYPIVTFYLLEWFTHNPWKTMKATPQVLNIVMFELVALLLFALFGRCLLYTSSTAAIPITPILRSTPSLCGWDSR